jgi:O-antigen/teichoic acid export membrane protein
MPEPLQQDLRTGMLARTWPIPILLDRIATPRLLALIEAVTAAATNFALSIVIARTYSATTFSGYLTSLSAVFVAAAFIRVSFSMPCAVRSDSWYVRKLPALAAVHGIALATATLVITLLLVAIALLTPGELWWAAVLFSPGTALWFLGYEFERGMLVKRGLHKRLALIGLAQALVVAIVLLFVREFSAPFTFLAAAMGVIGLTRTLITVLAVAQPNWSKGARQFRAGMRHLGPSAAGYLLGSVACSHAPVFSLSFFATAEQAAAFGAMRTLYQPMQVFFRSRDVIVQARFHSDRAADPRSLASQYRAGVLRTAMLSMLLSLVLLGLGRWLVHAVYGGQFDAHMTTFWLWAAIMLLINLASITDAYVSYASAQRRYARLQIAAGIATIALAIMLVSRLGDIGAAIAAIAGWLMIVLGGAFLVGRRLPRKGP